MASNLRRSAALEVEVGPNAPPVIMPHAEIIAVGASAGGVAALRALAAALPRTLPVPVLIVLHVGAHKSDLPKLLSAAGPLPARHAEQGEAMRPGHIYVAPPDHHMTIAHGRLRLSRGPRENWARPAIDPLFRSAAEGYGPGAIGVILTGNLNDGTLGLQEIKRRGGIAIAQDPADAASPQMPASAVAHVALDYVLRLAEIPEVLVRLAEGKDGKEAVMPITSSQPDASPEINNGKPFERPLAMTCPECGGALKRSKDGSIVKFGCHIGHSYTAEVMAAAQFDEMEKVMRAAVRCLNERAEFCLQMADQTNSLEPDASDRWTAASKQALERAYKLRHVVEQDWIVPEISGRPGSDDGRVQAG